MKNKWIESHPEIKMGKPVIKGTRISVETLLEKLAAGETIEQLLESYPRLHKEAILAAIGFAAEILKADIIYPTPPELSI
jgi:uncharacterized protein (DUF433 family)